MILLYLIIATVLYVLFSALWFSPPLLNFWLNMLKWTPEEVGKNPQIKYPTLYMYATELLAGFVMALMQIILLEAVSPDIKFWPYLFLILGLVIGFVCLPQYPSYLFKSRKFNMSMKEVCLSWFLDVHPGAIGALLQAIYLYSVIRK